MVLPYRAISRYAPSVEFSIACVVTSVGGLLFEFIMCGLDPFVYRWVSECRRDVLRTCVLVDQEPPTVGEPRHVAVRMTHLHDSSRAATLVVPNGRHDDPDGNRDRNEQRGGCQGREV